MRIGIISDIHDNLWNLRPALAALQDCQALLVLGDLCSPFTLIEIAQSFNGSIHIVWGNNDGDKQHLALNAMRHEQVTLHGDFGEIELGGKRIAIAHYPHLGAALAAGQQYDLVCHGHNHQRAQTWQGHTLLLNPGEIMGRFGAPSYAVYDTERAQAEIIELPHASVP